MSPTAQAGRQAEFVSVSTVARALRYAAKTIRERCQEGTIPATREGEGGHWRIPRDWLDARLRERGVVIRRVR